MPDHRDFITEQSTRNQMDHARSELASLRQELDHANRLATLGVLAAGIAHEINNILTPVLAYAQLAMSHPEDQQLHDKAIEKAVHGVQTATQITQAMLGFAGDPEQPAVANINEVLRQALDCIGRDPAKDRIDLTIRVLPDATVCMRPLALQQVLMNLILNASAVMRGRGGKLTISANQTSPGLTEIQVADTGPGIPADVAGRLFQPFVSASPINRRLKANANSSSSSNGGDVQASRPTNGGTGLGLAICRRLVEEANGTIAANSKPGTGTTISLTVPTAKQQVAKKKAS